MTLLRSALLLHLVAVASAQLQWEVLHSGNHSTGSVPAARRDAGIGYDVTEHVIVLFGGRTVKNGAAVVLGDTWIYDLARKTWQEVAPSVSPPPRYSFVSGFTGGYMYVSTGLGSNHLFLDDIWRFKVKDKVWEQLPAQPKPDYYTQQQWRLQSRAELKPAWRYGAAGGVFPNSTRFYVSHGTGSVRYADTYSYSIREQGWYQEFPDLSPYSPGYPHARCLHAGTMISADELLIFGGCLSGGGSGGPCPIGDSWILDGKSKTWLPLESCASPRTYATMATLPTKNGHRRVVLFGGEETGKQVLTTVEAEDYQVALFNPDTKTWTLRATQGSIPSKRASVSMATSNNGIYVFGGINVGTSRLNNDMYLLRGDGESADQAPLSAECHPTFFNIPTVHGVLMVLGWGFFLQWGAFIARYMDRKRALWFHLHRLFQVFGLLIALAGFVCGILSVHFGHFQFPHAIIGLVVMVFGLLQPINAIFRPNVSEGELKTVTRTLWEFVHKNSGRSVLLLALVNCSLGVFLAVSSVLLWSLWFAYLGVLVISYAFAQCNRKCVTPVATAVTSLPGVSQSARAGGRYVQQTNGLFGEKHHCYDNGALESEG